MHGAVQCVVTTTFKILKKGLKLFDLALFILHTDHTSVTTLRKEQISDWDMIGGCYYILSTLNDQM